MCVFFAFERVRMGTVTLYESSSNWFRKSSYRNQRHEYVYTTRYSRDRSGGARGIDSCAKEYAISHGITITEFLPEYNKYKKGAPLKRNIKIVQYADEVLAFWDGKSKGTEFVINYCRLSDKKVHKKTDT